MVDGKKRFLDVVVGFLGFLYDVRVLRNSRFYRRCENKELLIGFIMNVFGREIGLYLVVKAFIFWFFGYKKFILKER